MKRPEIARQHEQPPIEQPVEQPHRPIVGPDLAPAFDPAVRGLDQARELRPGLVAAGVLQVGVAIGAGMQLDHRGADRPAGLELPPVGIEEERDPDALRGERRDVGRDMVVLAGDVCYERPMAVRVAAWLAALAAGGAEVLIGDPGRTYLPKAGLERVTAYSVKTTRELEDTDVRNAVVWRVAG